MEFNIAPPCKKINYDEELSQTGSRKNSAQKIIFAKKFIAAGLSSAWYHVSCSITHEDWKHVPWSYGHSALT